jgi:hypothetical protein
MGLFIASVERKELQEAFRLTLHDVKRSNTLPLRIEKTGPNELTFATVAAMTSVRTDGAWSEPVYIKSGLMKGIAMRLPAGDRVTFKFADGRLTVGRLSVDAQSETDVQREKRERLRNAPQYVLKTMLANGESAASAVHGPEAVARSRQVTELAIQYAARELADFGVTPDDVRILVHSSAARLPDLKT